MKNLLVVSLIYILLPTVIFLATWVRPGIGISAIGLMCLLFFYGVRKTVGARRVSLENSTSVVSPGMILSSLIFSLILCLISEFGLSPYKSYDYMIHNFKFHLIATEPLPLYDERYGINLCYYLGFYMIPAMLGKLFGLPSIQYIAFIWIWAGLALSFIWLQLKLHTRGVNSFILNSGIWVALLLMGSYVNSILPLFHFLSNDSFISNNSVFLNNDFVLNQVPVFTRSLSESTQHALPAILGVSVLFTLLKSREGLFASLLFLFGTLFWSPFSTIGLCLFVAFAVLKLISDKNQVRLSLSVILYGLGLLVAFAPVIIFLLSSRSTDMASNKLIWNSGVANWIFYYLLYVFAFWGVWFLLLRKRLFFFDTEMLIISSLVFIVLGFLQMGYYNDLNIRATIPAQIVFSLSIVVVILRKGLGMKKVNYFLLLIFILGNSFSVAKFYHERFLFWMREVSITQ